MVRHCALGGPHVRTNMSLHLSFRYMFDHRCGATTNEATHGVDCFSFVFSFVQFYSHETTCVDCATPVAIPVATGVC